MSLSLNEFAIEQMALSALAEVGYTASEGVRVDERQERVHLSRAILSEQLERAISRINPELSNFLCGQVEKTVSRPQSPDLVVGNRWLHTLIIDGVPVEYKDTNTGETR